MTDNDPVIDALVPLVRMLADQRHRFYTANRIVVPVLDNLIAALDAALAARGKATRNKPAVCDACGGQIVRHAGKTHASCFECGAMYDLDIREDSFATRGKAAEAKAEPVPASTVYDDVRAERQRQDEQWGGPLHDDQHSIDDWCCYIRKQLGKIKSDPQYHGCAQRRFVKVAALAVAAVESLDRRHDTPTAKAEPVPADEPDWLSDARQDDARGDRRFPLTQRNQLLHFIARVAMCMGLEPTATADEIVARACDLNHHQPVPKKQD